MRPSPKPLQSLEERREAGSCLPPLPLGEGDRGGEGQVDEAVSFWSGPNRLEGRLRYCDEGAPTAAVLLLAPHPHFAGNLDNNVIRSLASRLTTADRAVLRFNYRGVDGSTLETRDGSPHAYWQRVEEEKAYGPIVDDAAAALDWLRHAVPSARHCHLVGYSFGAIIACLLAERVAGDEDWIDGVAVVAPPLRRYAAPFQKPTCQRRVFLLAEEDFLYGPGEIAALREETGGCERVTLAGADHFFRGQEETLGRHVAAFLERLEGEIAT